MRRATFNQIISTNKRFNFYPRSPCGERQDTPSTSIPNPDFYPRSPCGERHSRFRITYRFSYFYPRSPCGERLIGVIPWRRSWLFLSTLSLRRATFVALFSRGSTIFLSTLSLRRATKKGSGKSTTLTNFYPRSPCGERLRQSAALYGLIIFLSTLSLRRATIGPVSFFNTQIYFYPRSPCGERHTPAISNQR